MLFNLLHGGKQMNVHLITEDPGNDTTIPNAFGTTEDRHDAWETGIWIIQIAAGNSRVLPGAVTRGQRGAIPPGVRGCYTQH